MALAADSAHLKHVKKAITKEQAVSKTVIRFSEAAVWLVVLSIIGVVRYFTASVFEDDTTLWLVGLILGFALLYYTVIYHYFGDKQRHYIKDIADVVFIGILGSVAKDYGVYFFILYILPIAAAAFALDMLNSLVVATIACLFIAFNIILNTQFFQAVEPVYFGAFQIIFLLIMTLFTRSLALQLRHEQIERQFFEEKLRQVDEKLADVEAIEEEFVSITSHQLNTPLSIIRGYTSMLLKGDAGKLSVKQERYVKEVHEGSLRLMRMVKELLDITHINSDKLLDADKQVINVGKLTHEAIDNMKAKAKNAKVLLATRVATDRITITGNPIQLEQAIANLIDNAIKYSSPGQVVSVRLTHERNLMGNNAVITVEDHGIGIPEEEQSRIFQRFYRASNSQSKDAQGSGLGLYIVKRIIEAHKGSISFSSENRDGTEFKIRLPLKSR